VVHTLTPAEWRVTVQGSHPNSSVLKKVLYCGVVFWYLGHWMGAWTSVGFGGAPFGLVHICEGLKGTVKSGLVALIIASLYVSTGWLWCPTMVHATMDLGTELLYDMLGHKPGQNACLAGGPEPLTPLRRLRRSPAVGP
jgi:hypothetical protein